MWFYLSAIFQNVQLIIFYYWTINCNNIWDFEHNFKCMCTFINVMGDFKKYMHNIFGVFCPYQINRRCVTTKKGKNIETSSSLPNWCSNEISTLIWWNAYEDDGDIKWSRSLSNFFGTSMTKSNWWIEFQRFKSYQIIY